MNIVGRMWGLVTGAYRRLYKREALCFVLRTKFCSGDQIKNAERVWHVARME